MERADVDSWWELFKREINSHSVGIDLLVNQKDRTEGVVVPEEAASTAAGEYSGSCYVDLRAMHSQPKVRTADVRSLGKRFSRELAAIITDPPYGFNTEEDQRDLANVYREMIPIFLAALAADSQLVISVPEWSHTGRQLPVYTYKEFLTHQILVAADREGMEVIRSPYAVPHAGALFRAPFYWESERALRRSILHFRFRRRAG